MAQRKTLTEGQVAVLRWIGGACPDGVMADEMSARISAAALRNCGLIRTSGRGPTWKAKITAAGTEYLSQVDCRRALLSGTGKLDLRPRQDVVVADRSLSSQD